MGLFDRLKRGLHKTKQLLRTDVRDLFCAGELLDETQLDKFEARLIRTDMGVQASTAIVDQLRLEHVGRTVDIDAIWDTVKNTLRSLLLSQGETDWDVNDPLSPVNRAPSGPTVILVAGVNGVGKTTSIAKLAGLLKSTGHSVVLAAGDTFRAAAVEQLKMWSGRLGCDIVTRPDGTDPASVAYAGCERGLETQADFVIIDTAGRLQTQRNLMDELAKIDRVIGNLIPGAPHESLLVLDATTGQNGISQALKFSEAVSCSGIILAKLDGTAKGGIVVAIRQQLGIPVKYIGVGEQVEDIELFDADGFVNALFAD